MCSFQTHMQANILHICARATDMHSCACKVVGASACVAGCAFPHCMATRTLRNCGWVCCASAHSHIAWQRALWATIVDIVECLHTPTCTVSAPRRNTQQTCVLEKRVHTCVRASHMHMPSMATYTQHTHRNTHTHTHKHAIQVYCLVAMTVFEKLHKPCACTTCSKATCSDVAMNDVNATTAVRLNAMFACRQSV